MLLIRESLLIGVKKTHTSLVAPWNPRLYCCMFFHSLPRQSNPDACTEYHEKKAVVPIPETMVKVNLVTKFLNGLVDVLLFDGCIVQREDYFLAKWRIFLDYNFRVMEREECFLVEWKETLDNDRCEIDRDEDMSVKKENIPFYMVTRGLFVRELLVAAEEQFLEANEAIIYDKSQSNLEVWKKMQVHEEALLKRQEAFIGVYGEILHETKLALYKREEQQKVSSSPRGARVGAVPQGKRKVFLNFDRKAEFYQQYNILISRHAAVVERAEEFNRILLKRKKRTLTWKLQTFWFFCDMTILMFFIYFAAV